MCFQIVSDITVLYTEWVATGPQLRCQANRLPSIMQTTSTYLCRLMLSTYSNLIT